MFYKRLEFTGLIILLLGHFLQAQTMYLRQKNGMQTAYLLNNMQKMSFSNGNIIISKSDGNTDNCSISNIRYLNFNDLTIGVPFVESKDKEIRVYPNPVVDILNIGLSIENGQRCDIEIYSIEGKVFYNSEINSETSNYQINVSELAVGFYLCRIKNGRYIETIKFHKK